MALPARGMLTVFLLIRELSPTVQAVRGYEMFDKKEDNVLKIILKP
jgi:hypothetical protein